MAREVGLDKDPFVAFWKWAFPDPVTKFHPTMGAWAGISAPQKLTPIVTLPDSNFGALTITNNLFLAPPAPAVGPTLWISSSSPSAPQTQPRTQGSAAFARSSFIKLYLTDAVTAAAAKIADSRRLVVDGRSLGSVVLDHASLATGIEQSSNPPKSSARA